MGEALHSKSGGAMKTRYHGWRDEVCMPHARGHTSFFYSFAYLIETIHSRPLRELILAISNPEKYDSSSWISEDTAINMFKTLLSGTHPHSATRTGNNSPACCVSRYIQHVSLICPYVEPSVGRGYTNLHLPHLVTTDHDGNIHGGSSHFVSHGGT